jgi:hypothetical protein
VGAFVGFLVGGRVVGAFVGFFVGDWVVGGGVVWARTTRSHKERRAAARANFFPNLDMLAKAEWIDYGSALDRDDRRIVLWGKKNQMIDCE